MIFLLFPGSVLMQLLQGSVFVKELGQKRGDPSLDGNKRTRLPLTNAVIFMMPPQTLQPGFSPNLHLLDVKKGTRTRSTRRMS